MSDEQWLGAMRKYAGVHFRTAPDISSAGGEHQIAISLMSHAQVDAARFAALALKMPDDLPAAYFAAILEWASQERSTAKAHRSRTIARPLQNNCLRLYAASMPYPNILVVGP